MLLVLFATLCVSLTAGRVVENEFMVVKGEEETLMWPDKYTVKVTKLSLTANLVEDFVYWKTNESSRLDANNGAVKTITYIRDEDYQKYEIHPETDKDENVKTVCTNLSYGDDLLLTMDDILPDVYQIDFTAIRNETVGDKETILFESIESYGDEDNIHWLWAAEYSLDDIELIWAPIKYEVKTYNNKLGFLSKHEIWEFSVFDVDFDEDEAFDVESFGCTDKNMVKVSLNSDAVTKELKFIDPNKRTHVDHVFNSFKNKFNREYAHEEEHNLRKSIFQQNMRLISSTNNQYLGYKLGINQFADRTPEELKNRANLRRRPQGKSGNKPFPYTKEDLNDLVEKLPKQVDLRLDGLITPVHDQQSCGSCWTYGTTSAMEGALARKNGGKLIRLANQALIDCAWAFGASGCDGGTDDAAYEWMKNYGLPTEEEYGSYKNADGICQILNMTTIYPIQGYTDVTPFSNEALKVALFNHGPLSVSVEVTYKFSLYSSGIYYEKDCGPENLNHEVTLVGYGEQYGELFWILKNSYGVNWGVDGYMMISARDNDCGVATEPTYVVL